MGRVLLCAGKQAENPFFVERAKISVYSVEELCYCVIGNAYLIGPELMDKQLEDWLEQECELRELAQDLKKIRKRGDTLSSYARMILEYIGYGSREQVQETISILEQGMDLNWYGKRKAESDHLVVHRHYSPALKIYDSLLRELPEDEEKLKVGVLHNRGMAFACLFYFERAAESFRQAFELGGMEDSGIAWLVTKRLALEEMEYVDFVADQVKDCELPLKVEKLMEQMWKEFEGTRENRMLFTLSVCREEPNPVSYYDEVQKLVSSLKEHYREITAE